MSITTPFEDSGGTTWTLMAEEYAFLDAVAAQAPDRVAITVLGKTTAGWHDVQLVTIDTPTTPADAPSVLLVSLQHGNEPASREMALQTIRDLALTTDPALVGLLERCRFHVIPSVNASSFPTYRTVQSGGGRNMNREHLTLAVIESEYVQRAITDLNPVLVWDAHEHFATKGTRLRVEMLAAGHHQGDQVVNALSDDLMAAVQDELDGQSIPHGLYSPAGFDTAVLRSVASIRGRLFLLVETPALDDDVPRSIRVDWQCVVRDAILDWFTDHVEDASTVVEGGKARQAARTDPFDLTNGVVLNPPPSGYRLPAGTAARHLDVFGIEHTDDGETTTVPMAQASRGVIPYLFDPDAPAPVVAGERVYPAPDPDPDPDPSSPTLRYSDGRPVQLRRTDGTPIPV